MRRSKRQNGVSLKILLEKCSEKLGHYKPETHLYQRMPNNHKNHKA